MNTSEGNHCHFWFWFIHVAVVTLCQTRLHHHQKRTNSKLKNTLDLLLSFFYLFYLFYLFLNLLLTKSMISGTRSIFSTRMTFSKLLNHFFPEIPHLRNKNNNTTQQSSYENYKFSICKPLRRIPVNIVSSKCLLNIKNQNDTLLAYFIG